MPPISCQRLHHWKTQHSNAGPQNRQDWRQKQEQQEQQHAHHHHSHKRKHHETVDPPSFLPPPSGLQGPWVNLTFRWVAQHIASCPLAGAVGCVLPSCVQGLAEPGPRGEWGGDNKWSSSWGLVLLLLILVFVLLIGTLINIRRGHRNSGQRPSCSEVHFSSLVPAGLGTALATVTTSPNFKGVSFYFSCISFWRNVLYFFFSGV